MGKPAYSWFGLLLVLLYGTTYSFALAQEVQSPQAIGYYCNPDTESIAEGQYYQPSSEPCTYESASLGAGFRYGDIYHGAIGSSTLISGHSLGLSDNSAQWSDPASYIQHNVRQGDDVIVVIYQLRNGPAFENDLPFFRQYFTGERSTPPHLNYGFIRFKYGTAPPVTDPVIIIPGLLGSAQVNGSWEIDPILHAYDDLIDTFDANFYTSGVNLFTFPYDWRASNIDTAQLLKQKIEEVKLICSCEKVDLVAHSMGGLVARQYIQSELYSQDVDQLVFLSTPHLGAPKAYLMWEGGEVGPFSFKLSNLQDSLLEFLLELEAKEEGFGSLFNYVNNKPISSVRELLPITSYLSDLDVIREYPYNYPRNEFLENLDQNLHKLYDSGVKLYNFVGVSGNETVARIIVEDQPGRFPKWLHGYPQLFDAPLGNHGLVSGEGDGTVTIESASRVNMNIAILDSDHVAIVSDAKNSVYRTLSQENATVAPTTRAPISSVLAVKVESPVDILITTPSGKKIGRNLDGNVINDVDDAYYSGFETEVEYMILTNPESGPHTISVQGTDFGTYTLKITYFNSEGESGSLFMGSTEPNILSDFEVTIQNDATYDPVITPVDSYAPTIVQIAPIKNEYARSEQMGISFDVVDTSGIRSLHLYIGQEKIPNNQSIDLFYFPLGEHALNVSAVDHLGNVASSTYVFRLIATLESTLHDIERAYQLGWITSFARDRLLRKLRAATVVSAAIQRNRGGNSSEMGLHRAFDKILMRVMLAELDRLREGDVNDLAYNLLREDFEWLIKN